jgi:hypothetical protein
MVSDAEIIVKGLTNNLMRTYGVDRGEALSMLLSNPEYTSECIIGILFLTKYMLKLLEGFKL